VIDASAFVSGGCQNQPVTIMALAVRGGDHLSLEMKRRNV
jgi:choline dehydrogenase-like flavoprotein